MAFTPTPFGTPTQLVGEFNALEVDTLSFEAAAVALSRLAMYIENVEIPLRTAKEIARHDMIERFESETAPDGTQWFALDPEYAKRKLHDKGFEHPILTYSKDLKTKATSEAAWTVTGESIWYNTTHLPPYWRVHQEGSEGFGVKFVKVKDESVLMRTSGEGDQNLPPRPFIGLSAEAEGKILEAFDIWFSSGLAKTSQSYFVSSAGVLHYRTPQGRIGERVVF